MPNLSSKHLLVPVVFALLLAVGYAKADIVIYQATTSDHGNGLNFGPDGTSNPPGAGYWEMGNTITFANGTPRELTYVDVTLYGGGDVNYPIQMDIYSGSDPNSGTLLGTATAPAGYGTNTTAFNFSGLVVPNTVTYILSLPNQNGSYDSIYLYPILTSGAAPTVGSGPNSLWYGAPGSFVANSAYAVADGATTNFLQAQFNATVPEPIGGFLGVGLAGLLVAIRRRKIT